jgi:hypothetical protein
MRRSRLQARRDALQKAIPAPAMQRLQGIRSWAYRSKLAVASRRPDARAASPGAAAGIEGVVILGMHRSGTSLITRLVSLLGLALSSDDDLLVGQKGNPRGHWESKSLLAFDGRLLEELGGTWFCPPLLGPQELSRMLDRHGAEALSRLHHAHPNHPWVWKDPRACVLLPFWSAVLAHRAAYVLVVRHPFEVSDSLARRNGCTPALSLALWERYTRQAMLGAAGRPMMVCTYDEVLADPLAWCERLVVFLGEHGTARYAVDRAVAGAFAMDGLRRSRQSWTALSPGPLISPQQVALAEAASVFTTQASYVPPALPAETPETESIFSEIRGEVMNRSSGRRHLAGLPSHLVRAGPSKQETETAARPPVSIVLARGGAAVAGSMLAFGTSLPAGGEVLAVGAEQGTAGDREDSPAIAVREIACERPPSEVEALALGAQAARGRIVLLSTGELLSCDAWYEPVTRALAPLQVAGVGPVMRFKSSPERSYYGRAFDDEDLVARFVSGHHGDTLVPAPLLFGSFCAFDRRVLAAAGGIDDGFSSVGAAIAELSLRLWRMGFHCRIAGQVDAWSEDPGEQVPDRAAEDLYDRLRIAALHFDAERLRAFNHRAAGLEHYEWAAERLAASDIEQRRAASAAVCAFSVARYFESFPPALTR